MPNANYQRGRRYEYELAKEYREQGFDVSRTAGSHGKFDLILINPENGNVLLIQCKVVVTDKEAEYMCEKFRQDPPYPPGVLPKGVHQLMAIKITDRKSKTKCKGVLI